MLNAEILLKNKLDKHLNVFWQYDGKPRHENNITKAFINTLDSLPQEKKKLAFQSLFNYEIEDKDTFDFYLQSAPASKIIDSLPESSKMLIAFSPTGKTWGPEGIEEDDDELIINSITESLQVSFPNVDEEEIKRKASIQYKDTKEKIISRGESIPDAWIIIKDKNDKPIFCYAFENKLYDLDPFQLRNHWTKSLKTKEPHIVYLKYSDILNVFSTLNCYMSDEFIRYMYFLNYWEINNLTQIVGMDDNHIAEYAQERCRQLLSEISGKKVARHRGWMYKYDTNNLYNKEVGLHYCKDIKSFELPLCFGSNQTSARNMYKEFLLKGYHLDNRLQYKISFHYQYVGIGKNTPNTYYSEGCPIEKYIDFWMNNADLIHQADREGRKTLLNKMFNEGIITKPDYIRILATSEGYNNKLNICPEIVAFYTWPLDKAIALDASNSFGKEIKEIITAAYRAFNIEDLEA